MIENTALIQYARDEDDVSVELCICKRGAYLDWTHNPPDYVLYIPESLIERCAGQFIRELGRDYYGTIGLSEDQNKLLKYEISKYLTNGREPKATQAHVIVTFINTADSMSETHYLVFEGP